MSAILVTQNPIFIEGITSWLKMFQENISSITCKSRWDDSITKRLGETPQYIIIDCTYSAVDVAKTIAQQSSFDQTNSPHNILILPDLPTDEFAMYITLPVSALVHVYDARQFFSNEISTIGSNRIYCSSRFQKKFGAIPRSDDPLNYLTKTELAIAFLLLSGLSSKEIAAKWSRSTLTVEDHRKRIKNKIDINGGKKSLLDHLTRYTCWLSQHAHTSS